MLMCIFHLHVSIYIIFFKMSCFKKNIFPSEMVSNNTSNSYTVQCDATQNDNVKSLNAYSGESSRSAVIMKCRNFDGYFAVNGDCYHTEKSSVQGERILLQFIYNFCNILNNENKTKLFLGNQSSHFESVVFATSRTVPCDPKVIEITENNIVYILKQTELPHEEQLSFISAPKIWHRVLAIWKLFRQPGFRSEHGKGHIINKRNSETVGEICCLSSGQSVIYKPITYVSCFSRTVSPIICLFSIFLLDEVEDNNYINY